MLVAWVVCVWCALSGLAAPGGHCCLAPGPVPWLWQASCLWCACWPRVGAPRLVWSGCSRCSGRLFCRRGALPHPFTLLCGRLLFLVAGRHARVLYVCPCACFVAGSGGLASWARFGAPHFYFGRFVLLLCSAPSGLSSPLSCPFVCLLSFVCFFSLFASRLSLAFCCFQPWLPLALASRVFFCPPPHASPRFFFSSPRVSGFLWCPASWALALCGFLPASIFFCFLGLGLFHLLLVFPRPPFPPLFFPFSFAALCPPRPLRRPFVSGLGCPWPWRPVFFSPPHPPASPRFSFAPAVSPAFSGFPLRVSTALALCGFPPPPFCFLIFAFEASAPFVCCWISPALLLLFCVFPSFFQLFAAPAPCGFPLFSVLGALGLSPRSFLLRARLASARFFVRPLCLRLSLVSGPGCLGPWRCAFSFPRPFFFAPVFRFWASAPLVCFWFSPALLFPFWFSAFLFFLLFAPPPRLCVCYLGLLNPLPGSPCAPAAFVFFGCGVFWGGSLCAVLCCVVLLVAAVCCAVSLVVLSRCVVRVVACCLVLVCVAVCCAVSLGAVLRRVLERTSAYRCAVVRCAFLSRSVWCHCALCRALGRCLLALCFSESPRAVCSVLCVSCLGVLLRAVVCPCALRCVGPAVPCCAFPVLSALCGAALRCAGAVVLCWCGCVMLFV